MSRHDPKKYWRSPEELATGTPIDEPVADTAAVDRRRFLQLAGFAVGGAALVGCSRGVEHGVMPYLVRPEEITPGRPYWYASVCGGCSAGCGILAKARDGRPIKLEGNPEHPVSRGGLCAVGQASVLGLYDSRRLRNPLRAGRPTNWDDADGKIIRTLQTLRSSGRVRFLTDSTAGPTERSRIAGFLQTFADGRHVIHDPLSAAAVADAHEATHGVRRVPRWRFERAEVIVALGSDFLGAGPSPVEHAAAYRAGRRLEKEGESFSHHIQIESRLSITGSNADRRLAVPAGSFLPVLVHLAGELARLAGLPAPWPSLPPVPLDAATIKDIAHRLWSATRGRTLVVCGDNDPGCQRAVNYVNQLLGNYGSGTGDATVDLQSASNQRLGSDRELHALLAEIEAGAVDALFIRGVNPLHGLPDASRLATALDRVKLVVAFAEHEDETSSKAHFVCPEPHFLAAWGDAEPLAGIVSLRQPTIRPLGEVRPMLESLATWLGTPAGAYEILRDSWLRDFYPRRLSAGSFETWWNRTLHDGYATLRQAPVAVKGFDPGALPPADGTPDLPPDQLALELHPAAGMMDGRHAHNAWLHELPDPIGKTVWDNYAAIGPATAGTLALQTGDVIRIGAPTGEEAAIEIAVLVQPGQNERSIAVALGYGRLGTGRFAAVGPQWWEGRPTVEPGNTVGVNAAPLLRWHDGFLAYTGRPVRVVKTGRRHELATTQLHHSLDVPARLSMADDPHRPIVQETTLAAWRDDPHAGAHAHHRLPSLYPEHPTSPHHWGLAIDLTACTGCAACVIACQAENNIPVVGKDEVRRAREMSWIRIDRYYGGHGDDPDVVHMPMMCQHCDNAPCENVCPVQATVQSAEGLNQQIYNRCVGTRYCANNCPYKVRRFNWFEYPREDRLQNLALNPDVTVRSRGVMEKCSLCVQRIQDGKAEAKSAGRAVADGDIQPACAQSCPAQAITFGDMNDPESRVSVEKHDPRHFTVLEELGVKPVVGYLTLVRNREDA